MMAAQKRWVAGLCLAAGLAGSGLAAQAEPSVEMRALYNRLEKLERDLIDVQRQTYQAGSTAGSLSGAGYGPDPASAADLSLRLQSVEESLRGLTGRIEKLSHDLVQTQLRFNQFAEDVEFRFQELGSPGGRSLVAQGGAAGVAQGGAAGAGAAAAGSQAAGTLASPPSSLGTIPLSAVTSRPEDDLNRRSLNNATQAPGLAYAQPAALPEGPESAYEAAINRLKRGQFDVAEADLSNFLQLYPTHNLAGNAQYWLGETFYVRGAYRKAAEAFLTGYTTYASSSKAPDSLLKLGMTLAALGQQDQACATLGELSRRFPSASQAVTQRAQLERRRAGC